MVRSFWFMGFLVFATSWASESAPFRPVLTEIQPACSALGQGWQREYGLRIDDLSELQSLSSNELEVAKALRDQVQPLGIIGVADYSCSKQGEPLDITTVRVFVFQSSARASDWWESKYQFDGWEKHYTSPANAKHAALDSTQIPKRVVLAHNLWITSHHIQTGDEHLVLLDHILDRLGVN